MTHSLWTIWRRDQEANGHAEDEGLPLVTRLKNSWDRFHADVAKSTDGERRLDKLVAAFRENPTYGIQLGDDNGLATAERPEHDGATVGFAYKMAGHDAKYKVWAPDEYNHFSFCSGYFWDWGNGVRRLDVNPFRALAKTFISTDPAMTEQQMPGYVTGIALGFKNSSWLPVLGPVCDTIVKAGHKAVYDRYSANPYRITNNADHEECDPFAVAAHFEDVFGAKPSDFDYVRAVPWTRAGMVWTLPGMREALITSGQVKAPKADLLAVDLEQDLPFVDAVLDYAPDLAPIIDLCRTVISVGA